MDKRLSGFALLGLLVASLWPAAQGQAADTVRPAGSTPALPLPKVVVPPVQSRPATPKPLNFLPVSPTLPTAERSVDQVNQGVTPTVPNAPGTRLPNEISFRGYNVKVVFNSSSKTAHVSVNGKVAATLKNVGTIGKLDMAPGSKFTLFTLQSNTTANDCASYLLISVPMIEGRGKIEARSGFGACNPTMRLSKAKHGKWAAWTLVAFREDRAKASVATMRIDALAVVEVPARPCLFDRDTRVLVRCNEEFAAAAQGSVERGIETGDETVAGHRLVSYVNRSKQTATLELNGRVVKNFADTDVLHVMSGTDLRGNSLFMVWSKSTGQTCGAHMVVRIAAGGDAPAISNPFGACKQAFITLTVPSIPAGGSSWFGIAWKDGEHKVDIASWRDQKFSIETVSADMCFLNAGTRTNDCLRKFVPGLGPSGPLANAAPVPGGVAPSPGGGTHSATGAALAFQLLARNEVDKALAEFDKAILAQPGLSIAYAGRGYGLALKGRHDSALNDLDRAIQLDARSVMAFTWRGFAFFGRGEFDRAIAALDQAVVLDDKVADAYVYRGAAYQSKGDHDQAMRDLDKALELAPRHTMALGFRAVTWAAKNEFDKAIEDYSGVLAAKPVNIGILFRRGQAYEKIGNNQAARNDYLAATALKATTLPDVVAQGMARQRLNGLDAPAGSPGSPAAGQACNKQRNQMCL